MELGPPVGRPRKDPSERRRKRVDVRLCPSHKELIEREANRRSTSMTLAVVRIGFEEIKPAGRQVPPPAIRDWMLEQAAKIKDSGDESNSRPFSDILDFENYFYSKARELTGRQQKREELWEQAQTETRDRRLGIRLKPRRQEWLQQRADEQNTSRSSLLRARALEGIQNRCRLAEAKKVIESWAVSSRACENWYFDNDASREELRREMRALGQKMGTATWRLYDG